MLIGLLPEQLHFQKAVGRLPEQPQGCAVVEHRPDQRHLAAAAF